MKRIAVLVFAIALLATGCATLNSGPSEQLLLLAEGSAAVEVDVDNNGAIDEAFGGTNTATAAANTVFAGPASGADDAPAFRALTLDDIPDGVGGGITWDEVAVNTQAVDGYGYLVNASSGPITVTLPLNPAEGESVAVCDYASSAATNNITIARNGSNIGGAAEDLVIDVAGAGFVLSYGSATVGWKIVSEISAGGSGGATTEAELESQLTDVTDVYTSNDGALDQTVTLTGDADIQITGTYPDFTFSFVGSYLTAETDPVYSAWDKSTGISITESQISDLGSYLTSVSAAEVSYTNTTSGLTATDTQAAIDEVEGRVDTLEGASGASTADAVSITDSGGYYTGTDVEAALQEAGEDNAISLKIHVLSVEPDQTTKDGYIDYLEGYVIQ